VVSRSGAGLTGLTGLAGRIELDVVSGLPGVRTAELAHCNMEPLIRDCYTQWVARGRAPLVLEAAAAASLSSEEGPAMYSYLGTSWQVSSGTVRIWIDRILQSAARRR
jgi:hypothetical protein